MGGTTVFNSSIYTRGLPAEFDDWATRLKLPSWSFDALLPYFKKSQNHTSQPLLFPASDTPSSKGYSGTTGPWRTTTPPRITYPSATAFVQATKTLGVPLVQSLNDPKASATSIAVHEITGEYGRRTNVMEDFLLPEHGLGFGPGLRIGTGALVNKIEVDATGSCTGVWFEADTRKEAGVSFFARTKGEVILAAGTVLSPQLLMLSGVGPKEHLESLEIPVKVDLPGVGKGMSDHLGVYLPYAVPCVPSLPYSPSRSTPPDPSSFVHHLQIVGLVGPAGDVDHACGWSGRNLCKESDGSVHLPGLAGVHHGKLQARPGASVSLLQVHSGRPSIRKPSRR